MTAAQRDARSNSVAAESAESAESAETATEWLRAAERLRAQRARTNSFGGQPPGMLLDVSRAAVPKKIAARCEFLSRRALDHSVCLRGFRGFRGGRCCRCVIAVVAIVVMG